MNTTALGSGSDPGNPGPDDPGGDTPVKWRHSNGAPPSSHPIPGNNLFQWSQSIILYGHHRNTNVRARNCRGRTICFFSRCITNLCWKFGFCPLTIFSTDKDPPEGGEKGNRWQSETINSLCFFSCVLDIITITQRCHHEREAEEREEAGNSARCPESESEVLHSNYIIPCPPSHYKQQSLQSHHQDYEMRARIYFRLTCNCDLTLTTGKYSWFL